MDDFFPIIDENINPCAGCLDWERPDGCKSNGGCARHTNADHIRSMTDDVELAKYLCKLIREGVMMAIPGAHYSNADIEEMNKDWLDWLRQEAKYD